MIGYLLIGLVILLGVTSFAIVWKRHIGLAIPMFFFAIMLYTYGLGLFFPLSYVCYSALIILAFFVIRAITLLKSREKDWLFTNIFNSTFLLFGIFMVLFFLLNVHKAVIYIDEYTHWADVVKGMFQTDHLSIYQDNLWYASYPPGISLLQYFFLTIKGGFQEDVLYMVSQLFTVSLCLPFLTIKRNAWMQILLTGLVLFLFPTVFFHNYYDQIYVDTLVGILFAHNMTYLFLHPNLDRYDVSYLTLSATALILIKDIGFFFVLLEFIVLLYQIVRYRRSQLTKGLFIVIMALSVKLSWSMALQIHGVILKHHNMISMAAIGNIITGNGETSQYQIINNFVKLFSSNQIITRPISVDYFGVVVILMGLLYWFGNKHYKTGTDRFRYRFIALTLGIGSFVYVIGLLGTYLFQITWNEAVSMTSYDRYIVIFLNGFFCYLLFLFLHTKKRQEVFIVVTIGLILLMPTNYFFLMNFDRYQANYQAVEQLGQYLKPTDRVLFYVSHSDNYHYAQVHYYMRPYRISSEPLDGPATYITDSTQIYDWSAYQYLYLYQTDEVMTEAIVQQFGTTVWEQQLYQIIDGTKLKVVTDDL